MTDSTNPWPDFSESANVRSPFSILNEYAALLPERTNKLVMAAVQKRDSEPGRLSYSFYLTVPALGNYRHKLLDIDHGIDLYPVTIFPLAAAGRELGYSYNTKGFYYVAANEEPDFRGEIVRVFNAQPVIKIIGSLISQAKEIAPPEEDDIPF